VKKRFKHGPEELQMMAFFDYCKVMENRHKAWKLAYHIPNERKASIQRRITMARCGVKKGMPDICIPVPNDKYASLYIEMKVKPNKPSKEQLELLKELYSAGSYSCIAWSAEEAISVVNKYLENKL
jgi:hypothetical protein